MHTNCGAVEPQCLDWASFFNAADTMSADIDDPDVLDEESKACELADMLISLKHSGRLSAKQVCLISY